MVARGGRPVKLFVGDNHNKLWMNCLGCPSLGQKQHEERAGCSLLANCQFDHSEMPISVWLSSRISCSRLNRTRCEVNKSPDRTFARCGERRVGAQSGPDPETKIATLNCMQANYRLALKAEGVKKVFRRIAVSLIASLLFALTWTVEGNAEDVLDGRSFSGMIGPVENPDLEDTLFFDKGYFWSDICTRCGFLPGQYDTEEAVDGVRFTGTLESDSRGRFDYDGLVSYDGSIRVSITWERRRWYWTSRREIVFIGKHKSEIETASLSGLRQEMQLMDPDGNPMCARF